jgi:hypothetical protein
VVYYYHLIVCYIIIILQILTFYIHIICLKVCTGGSSSHNELNAQCVLTKLRAHYKGSQAAVNETQQLFKYIVTAKITDFSGSAQNFILHWFEQIRLYETLTEEKEHLQPEQKLAMLQDAVHPSPALAVIEASHQQIMSVHPDKEPTLDDYKALLLHTATQLDARGKLLPRLNALLATPNSSTFRTILLTNQNMILFTMIPLISTRLPIPL